MPHDVRDVDAGGETSGVRTPRTPPWTRQWSELLTATYSISFHHPTLGADFIWKIMLIGDIDKLTRRPMVHYEAFVVGVVGQNNSSVCNGKAKTRLGAIVLRGLGLPGT